MRLKDLFSAAAIAVTLVLPIAANATSTTPIPYDALLQSEGTGFLSTRSRHNAQLEQGTYLFGDHHKAGKGFFDTWSFSLAEAGDVTVNLFDAYLPAWGDVFLGSKGSKHGHHHNKWEQQFSALLDNKYLTISLFDGSGTLLGSAGENGLLTALGLAGDTWYTLSVSGKAAGLLGGVYYGSVQVAQTPLSDTLPLFGSALVVLALRKRWQARDTSTAVAA